MDENSDELEKDLQSFRTAFMTAYGEETPLQMQEFIGDILGQGIGVFAQFLMLGETFNRNKEAVGRIITLHLLMEERIDQILSTLIPGYRSEPYKCSQKIKLLPESGYLYTPFIDLMFEFCSVRNNHAHNLDASIEERDIPLINKIVNGIDIEVRFKDMMDITTPQGKVEFFAIWMCCMLLMSSKEVIDPYNILIEKYPRLEGRFEAIKRRNLPEEYKRYKLTLHDAMIKVLLEQENQIMEAGALADEVHNRKLYWKKNGEKATRRQILARARMYPQFEIKDLNARKHIKLI